MIRKTIALPAAALLASALLFAQSAPKAAAKPASSAAHQTTKDMPHAAQLSKAQKIALAESAGPATIAKAATIVDMTDMAKPATLREGTNGWVCYAMLQEPMCADKVWQKWAEAWMGHKPFHTDESGTCYMLRGDHGASNTDPWATEAKPDNHWVVAPAHVMLLLPDAKLLDAYPVDWKGGGPWVMWKGTPYAHIMLPVAPGAAAK
jgi:hypothetical protein